MECHSWQSGSITIIHCAIANQQWLGLGAKGHVRVDIRIVVTDMLPPAKFEFCYCYPSRQLAPSSSPSTKSLTRLALTTLTVRLILTHRSRRITSWPSNHAVLNVVLRIYLIRTPGVDRSSSCPAHPTQSFLQTAFFEKHNLLAYVRVCMLIMLKWGGVTVRSTAVGTIIPRLQ